MRRTGGQIAFRRLSMRNATSARLYPSGKGRRSSCRKLVRRSLQCDSPKPSKRPPSPGHSSNHSREISSAVVQKNSWTRWTVGPRPISSGFLAGLTISSPDPGWTRWSEPIFTMSAASRLYPNTHRDSGCVGLAAPCLSGCEQSQQNKVLIRSPRRRAPAAGPARRGRALSRS